jgi:hypothetical protein
VTGRLPTLAIVVAGAAMVASACVRPSADGAGTAAADPSTTIEDYPDAQTRALAARARERRPVERSALPPRHLDPDRFPESLVDRNRIVSGGPPPDGIPSIDEPAFRPAATIDWLDDDEAVAVLSVGDETRIYPAQILIWHEIVNDEIAGVPVAMTYCPLCNSVVAVERTIADPADDRPLVLDFGTSGALYQSALVMYDRQTESLWTHFDGRAVIGSLIGTELAVLPAAMVGWAEARAAHPEAEVLDRPAGRGAAPYGTAPYPNYESAPPSAGYVTGEIDDRLDPKRRVVGIAVDGDRVAIDRRVVEVDGIVEIDVGGRALVVLWEPGTASTLDGEAIAEGEAVGGIAVFEADHDGRDLGFGPPRGPASGPDTAGEVVAVDRETGSSWNVLGHAVAGPLAGRRLVPVAHLDTFWFAWVRYHPDTRVVASTPG